MDGWGEKDRSDLSIHTLFTFTVTLPRCLQVNPDSPGLLTPNE